MCNECPDIRDDARYSAVETAKLLGIHRNTLRNHTREGKIKFGIRRSNGWPYYTGREIKSYWRSHW